MLLDFDFNCEAICIINASILADLGLLELEESVPSFINHLLVDLSIPVLRFGSN
jgi:hypothetical protein